ncbi:MAG: bifunctional UDP-N-acetylglucosamine pyrophosphorylase / Glucosamine-1-phosphate N-acetyltransferase [Parcubacteria group bacterium Gr01-1014_72]|nr:MAG: bifunctional UDP-N-acetylglucosamine pyrophosphorylase / Glucosamine-1-phosphate N-acetyltransferase [Parcubacteria group bacterium Gr01-1014_72]
MLQCFLVMAMKAVILAAGRGKRMNHLTNETPKPLLTVKGKTLLRHKLDALPREISEVIIIVGYFGDKIRKHLGDSYGGRKITYVEQGTLDGTAGALHAAKHLLQDGHFLVMMGDDLYGAADISRMLLHPWALLAERVKMPKRGARVVLGEGNRIERIEERAELTPGEYNNTGLYMLGPKFFEYPLVACSPDEFGLPQTLVQAVRDVSVRVVEATEWFQITAPEDILAAEKFLQKTSHDATRVH